MNEPQAATARVRGGVGIRTLAMFLLGNWHAILDIASARRVLGVGFLFVLSAALAREYDGADLLAEPWRLMLPLAASLGTSLLLFALVFAVGEARGIGDVPFGRTYLRFLALYWMTAPLAWLYGIPVESFTTPYGAIVSNLTLLGLVSAWRVWLMTRVVQCLFNAGIAAAGSIVLLFADVVVLAAIVLTPKPIFALMGGIRLTEAEHIILDVTFSVGFACLVTLPIWLLSTLAIASGDKKWAFALTGFRETAEPTRGLWCLAAGAVAAWMFVLPITQPRQRLAHRVDSDLRSGRIKEALAAMAAHQRGDFPPHWEPPPHVGYGEREPPILDVMEVVVATNPPVWVHSLFTTRFSNSIGDGHIPWTIYYMDDDELNRFAQVLLKLPEGPALVAREENWLRGVRDEPSQSDTRRAAIDALLELAGSHDPKGQP